MPESVTEAVHPTLLAATSRAGTVLRGKWRLDRLLGVGGMAAVYAGTHRNGSRGAIKILHRELSAAQHVRSRFLKEGYVANKVDHPGVVRVLDDDVAEDGSLFIVMELLDGESLEQRRVRSGGRLDADEVLAVADQLLDVLAAAHEKGIVHRDIKPDNVLLTRDGAVKVLDFGIARLRELSTASQATKAGTTMGTPAYMSPEHARGLWEEVDARSDLWSVGATMFELLTGQLVHNGRTTNEQLLSAMSSRAASIASAAPGISPFVAEVIDRSLAYEKADRYPDARAMQDAVRRAFHRMHGAPITSRPHLTVPPSVPNKTLPSAGSGEAPAPLATMGAAVSRGRTGIPIGSIVSGPRAALFALVAAGAVGVVVIVALVVALDHHTAPASAAAPASALPSASAAAPARSASAAPAASTQLPDNAPVPVSALPEESAEPRHKAKHEHRATRPKPAVTPEVKPAPKQKPAKPGLQDNQNW